MSKSRKTTYTTSNDDYPSANNRRNSNFNNNVDKSKSNKHGNNLGKNKNSNINNSYDDNYDEDNAVYDYDDYHNTTLIPTVEATVIPYDDIDNSGKLKISLVSSMNE